MFSSLIPDFLQEYLTLIRLGAALLVFLIFWGLKQRLTRMLARLLHRVLCHRRQWISLEAMEQALVPCRSMLALLGLYLAMGIAGILQYPLVTRGFRIAILALVTWVLLRVWDSASGWIFSANESIGEQLSVNLSKTLITFLNKAVKVLLLCFAGIIILSEAGVQVTALITGLGLGGLTFALAAQDTASNLFSGLVILLDRPFCVEDWIQTPTIEGVVEDITFRSTRIRTFANAQVVVPNSSLTSQPITNWSRMQKRRISFSIGLEYGTSSEQLRRCVQRIEALLAQHPGVVEDSGVVSFNAFLDSSLEISVLFFSKETGFAPCQKIKEDVNLHILQIIEEEGCSFAFPTQTVHLKNS